MIQLKRHIFFNLKCIFFNLYRQPNTLVPTGEIDIATATFDFDASNVDKPGQFQIK